MAAIGKPLKIHEIIPRSVPVPQPAPPLPSAPAPREPVPA